MKKRNMPTRLVDVKIVEPDGTIVFEKPGVEVPAQWSDRAATILAVKYFAAGESSAWDVFGRVCKTISSWGLSQGYFANTDERDQFKDRLMDLFLDQRGMMNTPVLINFGVKENEQQGSACFIYDVQDNMESILEFGTKAGLTYKSGSGTGVNVSKLRAKGELLSNRGAASGPISFMHIWDQVAGSIRSGGKTRRAASMVIMDVDHPDIEEFIGCKIHEEKKAKELIKAGYSKEEAYNTVSFQNANHSIMLNREFMDAVNSDSMWKLINRGDKEIAKTVNAKDLFHKIAAAAWETGDPGIMFRERLNDFNPIPSQGEILGTNPCQPGCATVLTPEGIKTFDDINIGDIIWSGKRFTKVINKIATGNKPVFRYQTTAGAFVGTEKHRIVEHGIKIPVKDAKSIDRSTGDYLPIYNTINPQDIVDGWVFGDGSVHKASNSLVYLYMRQDDEYVFSSRYPDYITCHRPGLKKYSREIKTTITAEELPKTYDRVIPRRFLYGSRDKVIGFLRGLYNANGSVCGNRVTLKASSFNVISDTQQMLSSIGIKSYYTTNKKHKTKFSNGEYECKESYNLNITVDRDRFAELIGFDHNGKMEKLVKSLTIKKSLKPQKDSYEIIDIKNMGIMPVWDITVEADEHTYWTGGLLVSNCAEFTHIPNSACNLASLNLVKYIIKDDDGYTGLNWKQLAEDINTLVTAQDIIIDKSSYPTQEVRQNSMDSRPLGLGFANLGAMLLHQGVQYDSQKGLDIAKEITRFITRQAYLTSISLAQKLGQYKFFTADKERAVFLALILAGDDISSKVQSSGLRNSQLTLLAPTGCLAPNSIVLTSKGLINIEELGDSNGSKWQDIDVYIAQEDQVSNSNKFFINGESDTISITTKRGHSITSTPGHKLRVINNEGDYVWREAKDIQKGDLVALRLGGHEELLKDKAYAKLPPPTKETNLNSFCLDEHVASIIGYYMGDGYLKKRGGLHLVMNNQDKDLLEWFGWWSQRTKTNITIEERTGCFIANNHSRSIYQWFKDNGLSKPTGNHGEGAAGAFIPKQILRSNTKVLCAFLRGLFEADGTITLNGINNVPLIEITTVSYRLASETMIALESLGIPVTMHKYNSVFKSFGRRTKYRLSVSSTEGSRIFYDKINFLSDRKKQKLEMAVANIHCSYNRNNGIRHQGLIDDLYYVSEGLPSEIRSNISIRKRNGAFNLDWARKLIGHNPQLDNSKLAKIIAFKNLQFVEVETIEKTRTKCTYDISVPENNTYVANGFISHNTIAYLMDCDTTGIEPLYATRSYKKLHGGGVLEIIPKCVEAAESHGIPEKEIVTAQNMTIENHINMMAACQKYLHGSISKTVNLPNDATVEDVERAYRYAYESGLKNVAIYRDGSKELQPLNVKPSDTTEASEETDLLEPAWSAIRKKLPDQRQSITKKFNVAGLEGYITIGFYESGDIGEIFIRTEKTGTTIQGILDGFATAVSLGLQYGVPLDTYISKFIGSKFEPAGYTSDENVRMATSVLDYIFKWIKTEFTDQDEEDSYSLIEENRPSIMPQKISFDGPPCPSCQTLTARAGSCYVCPSCGSTTGCS